jgi:serine/threonine protein kinase
MTCPPFFWRLMTQMLDAIAYLHREKLIHRDVKPDNILFDEAEDFYLADFGLSKELDSSRTVVGTPIYMAPEVFSNKDQTAKVDIWSIGILALQVLNYLPPFTFKSIWDSYEEWHHNVLEQVKRCIPQMKPMFENDPEKRYSARQCLEKIFHPSAAKKWVFNVPGLNDGKDAPKTGLTTMFEACSIATPQAGLSNTDYHRVFNEKKKNSGKAPVRKPQARRATGDMDWTPEPRSVPHPQPTAHSSAASRTALRAPQIPSNHTSRTLVQSLTSTTTGSPMQLVPSKS